MDRDKFENLVYEIARAWGINDRDLEIVYEIRVEEWRVDILVRLLIPVDERVKWVDFWTDVSRHTSKEFDIMIFVEHKNE